jgi:hypothetical protein
MSDTPGGYLDVRTVNTSGQTTTIRFFDGTGSANRDEIIETLRARVRRGDGLVEVSVIAADGSTISTTVADP